MRWSCGWTLSGQLGCLCLVAFMLAWQRVVPAADMEALRMTNALLTKPMIETQTIFEGGRCPNVVVGLDGTVVAVWGLTQLVTRRSEDGGATWQDPVLVQDPAIHAGGALVNEANGEILIFAHPKHPDRQPTPPPVQTMYRSRDAGRTWEHTDAKFLPDVNGYVPAMHMSEKGVTLRHESNRGRLLRPARVYIGANQLGKKHDGYNTASYSDDGGTTWQASAPFPDRGTGEGALVELADGTIYYSSRKQYFHDSQPLRPGRDYALSRDGGQTWVDLTHCKDLPDGPRYRGEEKRGSNYNGHFGLMAGVDKVTDGAREILLYTNADSDGHERKNLSMWASLDGGRTWPVKRRIHDGPSAYSAIAVGRPGTPSEGWIYVLYEGGPNDQYESGRLARFNLAWLLEDTTQP